MDAKEYTCEVIAITKLNSTTLEIKLRAPDDQFTFEPGQFVSLFIPQGRRKNDLKKRAYSIASNISDLPDFSLCVGYIENGIGSEYVNFLKPGHKVKLAAPFGDFTAEQTPAEVPVYLIATGTGIGPIRSMLLSKVFAESPIQKPILLFGARNPENLLYIDELSKLAITQICMTGSNPLPNCFKGRVTDYLKTQNLPQTAHVYICGNGAMVSDVLSLLKGYFKIDPKQIHFEAFLPAPIESDDRAA